jgi:type II secretory pathway component PulF
MANRSELAFAKLQFGFSKRVAFYREFASLLRAGMAKTDAIALLAEVAADEGRRAKQPVAVVLNEVLRNMRNGQSFGEAIRQIVPPEDRMILEAGENSDDFPAQLDEYCGTMRKKRKIIGTIVGGLAYPILLFLMVYGMLFYFGTVVVPELARLLPPENWTGPAAFLAFLGRFAEVYAGPLLIAIVLILIGIFVSLPRWRGRLRVFADQFPIFALYRLYTGTAALVSIAALMRGGIPAISAIERILPSSTPYVRERLVLIRRGILNGLDFGEALHRTRTSWPDYNMTLSIKVFARTQDLAVQMSRLSQDWLDLSQERIEERMGVARTTALGLVFVVIAAVVAGMYSLQSQIAVSVQR